MKIAVLGGDGYCGWATALYLSAKGHTVSIVDNFIRRLWDHELGAQTLTPIRPLAERLRVWRELTGRTIDSYVGDVDVYKRQPQHRRGGTTTLVVGSRSWRSSTTPQFPADVNVNAFSVVIIELSRF